MWGVFAPQGTALWGWWGRCTNEFGMKCQHVRSCIANSEDLTDLAPKPEVIGVDSSVMTIHDKDLQSASSTAASAWSLRIVSTCQAQSGEDPSTSTQETQWSNMKRHCFNMTRWVVEHINESIDVQMNVHEYARNVSVRHVVHGGDAMYANPFNPWQLCVGCCSMILGIWAIGWLSDFWTFWLAEAIYRELIWVWLKM